MLCSRLDEPGGPLSEDAELRALTADVVARVRADRPQDEVDERLDDLEDRLLVAGHTAALGSYRTVPTTPSPYEPLPGLGSGRPLLDVLACPRARCTRVEAPVTTGAPRCALFDEALLPFDVTA